MVLKVSSCIQESSHTFLQRHSDGTRVILRKHSASYNFNALRVGNRTGVIVKTWIHHPEIMLFCLYLILCTLTDFHVKQRLCRASPHDKVQIFSPNMSKCLRCPESFPEFTKLSGTNTLYWITFPVFLLFFMWHCVVFKCRTAHPSPHWACVCVHVPSRGQQEHRINTVNWFGYIKEEKSF